MAKTPMFAVVTPTAALSTPYPYIYVNEDGSARELYSEERKYLETPFMLFDGGMPYIKDSYKSMNGWKSIKGFCLRSKLPNDLYVAEAPATDPNPPMSKAEHIEYLRKRMSGFEVNEKSDGTIVAKRTAKN